MVRPAILMLLPLWLPAPSHSAAVEDGISCRNLRSAAECVRPEGAKASQPSSSFVLRANVSEVQTSVGVMRLEKLEITPDPEDQKAPEASRWEKMERALGPGKSAKREWVETFDNAGGLMACMKPCPTPLCCVRAGEFSLAHPSAPGGF